MAPDAPLDATAPAPPGEGPGIEAGPAPAAESRRTASPAGAGADSGGEETFIARAPATEVLEPPTEDLTAEPDEEPAADPGAISAEAQGDMEALGAGGGGEYAGGGGGGGGGGAVEAEPEQPAPDVSNADPAAAVSQAANLKPAQMLETLGGAEKAAANHVTKEHEKLAAQPPELEAGGGADGPAADEKHVSTPPSRPTTTKAAAEVRRRAREARAHARAAAEGAAPGRPGAHARREGQRLRGRRRQDQGRDRRAPDERRRRHGPADQHAEAHPHRRRRPRPDGRAEGPSRRDGRRRRARRAPRKRPSPRARTTSRRRSRPRRSRPRSPPAAPRPPRAPRARAPTTTPRSIVAEQESGPQLKAAAAQASAQINAEKSQHASKAAQTKAAAVEEAHAEEAKGKADQIAEHAAAKAGVSQARQDWTGEQKQQADAAKLEATGAVGEAQTAIQGEKTKAEAEAIKHVDAGRKEAEDAKRKGDDEARKEKEKAKEDSGGGGFFGWVASKAKALYDKVKDGITAVFNKVRSAITTAINKAKELAHSVIDRAVKFVADKVKAVAGKLLAIGDKLIPGFAAARQKFGKWIKDRVKQAVTALNKIVTAVKDGIRKVMSAVGNALKAGLDLLKKGISAAIDAVKNVVKAAIEKAKAAIAALGQFAAIIKDIASNPGQWLSNLGAAVMDGIKNHLWKALKTAVQTWFNEKLESLLGLGKSVLNLLTKGGISMAQVGKMAFEALKAAIPPALIALLVERLVSMIVPAAGAVMAVVQGLMAAWGAIQKILAAIDRFIAFLKAVKSGGAGPAFANALAAAAVAVIEFVSQFLLRKIAGAASKVAGKIKAIAQKIGKKLMAGLKKVGKKLKRGATRLKDKVFGKKKTDKKDQGQKDDKQDKQDRLDKAVRAHHAEGPRAVEKGISQLRLKAQLAVWKLRYRLSALEITGSGKSVDVHRQGQPRGRGGTRPTRPGTVRSCASSSSTRGRTTRHAKHPRSASRQGQRKDGERRTEPDGLRRRVDLRRRPGCRGRPGARRPTSRSRSTPKKGDWNNDRRRQLRRRVHVTSSEPTRRAPAATMYVKGIAAVQRRTARTALADRPDVRARRGAATVSDRSRRSWCDMLRDYAAARPRVERPAASAHARSAPRTCLFGPRTGRNTGELAFGRNDTRRRIPQGDRDQEERVRRSPAAWLRSATTRNAQQSGGENPKSFRGATRRTWTSRRGGPSPGRAKRGRARSAERRDRGAAVLRDIAQAETLAVDEDMRGERPRYFNDESARAPVDLMTRCWSASAWMPTSWTAPSKLTRLILEPSDQSASSSRSRGAVSAGASTRSCRPRRQPTAPDRLGRRRGTT